MRTVQNTLLLLLFFGMFSSVQGAKLEEPCMLKEMREAESCIVTIYSAYCYTSIRTRITLTRSDCGFNISFEEKNSNKFIALYDAKTKLNESFILTQPSQQTLQAFCKFVTQIEQISNKPMNDRRTDCRGTMQMSVVRNGKKLEFSDDHCRDISGELIRSVTSARADASL